MKVNTELKGCNKRSCSLGRVRAWDQIIVPVEESIFKIKSLVGKYGSTLIGLIRGRPENPNKYRESSFAIIVVDNMCVFSEVIPWFSHCNCPFNRFKEEIKIYPNFPENPATKTDLFWNAIQFATATMPVKLRGEGRVLQDNSPLGNIFVRK